MEESNKVASGLLDSSRDLREARVCVLAPPNFDYVVVQWGVWRAGGVMIPLCTTHPLPEIEYAINDSDSAIIVYHPQFKEFLNSLLRNGGKRKFVTTTELQDSPSTPLPTVSEERRAMIVYTSGTTSKPKGVVSTHRNVASQIKSLVEAWEWSASDRIVNILPLHHLHGIINVVSCALWSGAECEMLPGFDAKEVWRKFITKQFTLFMAVPTIYQNLIRYWKEASQQEQREMSEACRKFRLMVSGSAPLSLSVFEEWKKISGHVLLERYGMTEIGMALSNPLHGERKPGYVGTSLSGVEIKLVGDDGNDIAPDTLEPGEIYVKGPNVFLEYWRRPEIMKESFMGGWFKTGDIALRDSDGYYKILGRRSTDIIKTGGYKVSALEIEEVLRTHPDIRDCVVVGVEDEYWGERVCAALVLDENKRVREHELSEWAKLRLANYKVPKQFKVVNELPVNPMGKAVKAQVKKWFR